MVSFFFLHWGNAVGLEASGHGHLSGMEVTAEGTSSNFGALGKRRRPEKLRAPCSPVVGLEPAAAPRCLPQHLV